ncbi:unnamed protein product [Nippostrongylus brasiliensis]|uniref:Uncharacterized protein n=1 Tax=Nippostrongylus brasiliensis TaxID=27835 RepID=A0A0N4XK63_NIPBR|nr:unnamed protein product [Nippostrongylus brasiliensis]
MRDACRHPLSRAINPFVPFAWCFRWKECSTNSSQKAIRSPEECLINLFDGGTFARDAKTANCQRDNDLKPPENAFFIEQAILLLIAVNVESQVEHCTCTMPHGLISVYVNFNRQVFPSIEWEPILSTKAKEELTDPGKHTRHSLAFVSGWR